MKTILFQGDSITDVGRIRQDPADLGAGYPRFVDGRLGLVASGRYRVLNRGISGDRVVDIYARIKADILNLKPDYLSILVGVNDVWHELDAHNGVSAPKFRKIYGMLLEEIRQALPDTQILLLEPFVLRGTATAEHYPWFRQEVTARAAAVAELAREYGLPLLTLQADLDALEKTAPEGWWLYDGVHPTAHFHQYLADKWLALFREKMEARDEA